MECKENKRYIEDSYAININRYIVECKVSYFYSTYLAATILIDT